MKHNRFLDFHWLLKLLVSYKGKYVEIHSSKLLPVDVSFFTFSTVVTCIEISLMLYLCLWLCNNCNPPTGEVFILYYHNFGTPSSSHLMKWKTRSFNKIWSIISQFFVTISNYSVNTHRAACSHSWLGFKKSSLSCLRLWLEKNKKNVLYTVN